MSGSNGELANFLLALAGDLNLSDQQTDSLERAAERLRAIDNKIHESRGRLYSVTVTLRADTAEEALRTVVYADGEVIEGDIEGLTVERIG